MLTAQLSILVEYSYATDLLGFIVEEISGKPLAAYLLVSLNVMLLAMLSDFIAKITYLRHSA